MLRERYGLEQNLPLRASALLLWSMYVHDAHETYSLG